MFDNYYDGFSNETPENYKFYTLKELGEFVKTNRHLPALNKDIYTGASVEVGLLPELLLEKTEEQAIYIIELNNKLEQQQQQINQLRKEVTALKLQNLASPTNFTSKS